MPKTNIAYGKSYKSCPCAQINDHTTTNNTYFTATCYSPKHNRPLKISDSDQTRVCMGGTSHGKRYTSCPYYVKNANINAPKVTKSNSATNVLYHVIGGVILLLIGSTCISSGVEYSAIIGFGFVILGILSIATLFKKNEKIDTGTKRKKKK